MLSDTFAETILLAKRLFTKPLEPQRAEACAGFGRRGVILVLDLLVLPPPPVILGNIAEPVHILPAPASVFFFTEPAFSSFFWLQLL